MVGYKLNYYLNRDKKSKNGLLTIYLYVRNANKTIVVNTKKKIDEKYWDVAKQKAKRHYKFELELNNFLKSFKDEIEKTILNANADNMKITYEDLKVKIMESLQGSQKLDFFKTFEDYIIHKETTQTRGTTKVYRTCLNHLKQFEKSANYKIEFENINQLFFDKFQDYFIRIGNSNNYAKKMMVTLKTFLNYCIQREISTDTKFQSVERIKTNKTNQIALTYEELKRVETVTLSDKLDRARDLFLFGLYTGQRYSDFSDFNIMDVKDNIWVRRQQKTKTVVNVPLHHKAISILAKYNYVLPKLANQRMNEYLKEIGKLAELNEMIKIIKVVGNQEIENVFPKYELLTTHTARRTFVTLSKLKGIDTDIIKATTGHGSDKMVTAYFVSENLNSIEVLNQLFGD
jgi:integrase